MGYPMGEFSYWPRRRSDIAQVEARQFDRPVEADPCDIEEIFADVYPGDDGAAAEVASPDRGA